MTRLLVTHLRPYRAAILVVLALQLVQAIANLYLPDLNADIINNGVVQGRHRLHRADRRADAGGHPRSWASRRSSRSISARGSPWASAATSAARSSAGRGDVLPDRDQHVRHGLAHHPQHQRRPAGPDGRDAGPDHDDLSPDDGHRRHDHGPPPGRAAVGPARRDPAAHGRRSSARHDVARDAAVPGRCRSRSTGSTRSCARRWPACASSAPSCGPATRRGASTTPTTT